MMQYVLTEEEYHNKVERSEFNLLKLANAAMRNAIVKAENYPCGKSYCDDCPVVKIQRVHGGVLAAYCNLSHNFSK